MKAFKAIIAISIAFASCFSQAKELKSEVEAKDLVNKVMSLISADDVGAGFQELKDFVIIPSAELEVLQQRIKGQMPLYASRYGKSIGFELMSEEKSGSSLLKITCIQKFDRHILRWQFVFYKAKSGWVLNSFKFDDDIWGLF